MSESAANMTPYDAAHGGSFIRNCRYNLLYRRHLACIRNTRTAGGIPARGLLI